MARLKALMAEQDAARRAAESAADAAKRRADAAGRLARALKAKRRAAEAARPTKTTKTPEAAKTPKTPTAPKVANRPPVTPRKLTDEQARELHRRWQAGEHQKPLAAGAGVDDAALRRHWAALELPALPPEDMRTRTGKPSPLTEAEAIAVHKRYTASESSIVLAAEVGTNRQGLVRAFRRHRLDVKAWTRLPPRPFHPALTPAAVKAAIERNAAGEEWKAIAASLGCCPRALRLARRRFLENELCQ